MIQNYQLVPDLLACIPYSQAQQDLSFYSGTVFVVRSSPYRLSKIGFLYSIFCPLPISSIPLMISLWPTLFTLLPNQYGIVFFLLKNKYNMFINSKAV